MSYLKQKEGNFVKTVKESKTMKERIRKCDNNLEKLQSENEKVKKDSKAKDDTNKALQSAFKESEKRVKDLEEIIGPQELDIKRVEASVNTDEDLPSTSKCGKCDYESESETDMESHFETNHELTCNTCDFTCCSKQLLENHIYEKHRKCESERMNKPNLELDLECENCNLTCKTKDKLEKHLCRVTVKNPSIHPSIL